MVKFKDSDLQKKYGRLIAELFAEHEKKLEILSAEKGEVPEVNDVSVNVEETLIKGRKTYWSLEYNKDGSIKKVKPYTAGTVIRNLRNSKPVVKDVFADFDSRGGLR